MLELCCWYFVPTPPLPALVTRALLGMSALMLLPPPLVLQDHTPLVDPHLAPLVLLETTQALQAPQVATHALLATNARTPPWIPCLVRLAPTQLEAQPVAPLVLLERIRLPPVSPLALPVLLGTLALIQPCLQLLVQSALTPPVV